MIPRWDISETIFRYFPGGLAVFSSDGETLILNPVFCEISGYSNEDFPDLETLLKSKLLRPEVSESLRDMVNAALEGRNTGPRGLTLLPKMGGVVFTEIYTVPVVGKDEDDIVAVGLLMFDVTPRKLLERERQEMEIEYLSASRMATLGELAGGIAHNINNPLAGLFGYLELLQDDLPDDERITKCIKQCKRIGEIARNMSYHGRNTEQTETTWLDINELIQETMLLISASKLYDNVTFEMDLVDHPATVHVNPGDLTQVLLNLLRNARDAVWGKDDRNVIIKTSEEDGMYVLSVIDNGHGIPDELQDSIFTPFFSTKKRTPDPDYSPSGNGLGLSTCKYLMEQNAGKIDFSSTENVGTEFRVYLPRVEI